MKKKRRCDRCDFWVRHMGINKMGMCRHNSPVVLLDAILENKSTEDYNALWPNTLADDWCGEFSQYER